MNLKIFSLMSRVNKTIFLVQYESWNCECVLNESVCNSKLKWNNYKCWCECKKLDNLDSF